MLLLHFPRPLFLFEYSSVNVCLAKLLLLYGDVELSTSLKDGPVPNKSVLAAIIAPPVKSNFRNAELIRLLKLLKKKQKQEQLKQKVSVWLPVSLPLSPLPSPAKNPKIL